MSRPASRMRAMPPPPSRRAAIPLVRSASAIPTLGRESIVGETNISVFVRCRGRNEREVRENSGVVVNTEGVKGTAVELSMGPNALSNKTYHFDRVFSPAADQTMLFDEVVTPILDEVLGGFNCTIFAYGQTGTGKTYTMSGDISDQVPLPDNAGIVPRLLHSLFQRLDALPNSPTTGAAPENSVKISFIELYNEDLRDLLSGEDNSKLKIFDGDSKRGAATLVQGMEERYITSARKGIQLLRSGSHKRQVAATKCNDLSSRSHTVFTVSVMTKRRSDSGEEMCTGKLNLVDLAGSENIGRSGAEKKHAAEAGLINKSLLTLGRVINALVDRSAHIPYRESKLTRLLQDSLGGRTKTCIIATLSPARSNLEETISTLDYAFRAKNIRNKPQINQLMSKKTLLKEFTLEIEKLKSELIATRQKNGVYLTQENYADITNESESRKVQVKEQRERIETIECNLKNKVQEFFNMTNSFNSLKKDSETMKTILDSTKSLLEKTEAVLETTRKSLDEETFIREQHEKTEEQLAGANRKLVSTLGQTTTDIGGLHAKLRRRSDLHNMHRQHWTDAQKDVSDVTTMVEDRLQEFQEEQQLLMDRLSSRMQIFVEDELEKLNEARTDLKQKSDSFEQSHRKIVDQTTQSKKEMSTVLNEIENLREDVKDKVGAGLADLGIAAQRISAGIISEIENFHSHLHASYSSLGREFKSTFDDLTKEVSEQREELEQLRSQACNANQRLHQDQGKTITQFSNLVEKEKETREQENQDLMQRIQQLVDATAKQQQLRMLEIGSLPGRFKATVDLHSKSNSAFAEESQNLIDRSTEFGSRLVKSRDAIKGQIQIDFVAANQHTETLRSVTGAVHDETTRIVKEQVDHLDTEMHALDAVVERIQGQNDTAHEAREKCFGQLASTVQTSYGKIGDTFAASFDRVESLKSNMAESTDSLQDTLPSLGTDAAIRKPLSELRDRFEGDRLEEYVPTGQTPSRKEYQYPKTVHRTADHESLANRVRSGQTGCESPPKSPSKGLVFADKQEGEASQLSTWPGTSLRELDVNSMSAPLETLVPLKRPHASKDSKVPQKKKRPGLRSTVTGSDLMERENLTMPSLSASVGMGAIHPGVRRLRSHERAGV